MGPGPPGPPSGSAEHTVGNAVLLCILEYLGLAIAAASNHAKCAGGGEEDDEN